MSPKAAGFPHETQEGRYYDRLLQAYPIHPEVFDRLYEDWTTIDGFQRTRGVLKLMAKVIYRLWKDGNKDLMILPGSLPLYDGELPQRGDLLPAARLGRGDRAGHRRRRRAETTEIEDKEPRFGSVQRLPRAWPARSSWAARPGLGAGPYPRARPRARAARLPAARPENRRIYTDALGRLADRLHYLNRADDRFWFDTRANLRREMEERKRRFRGRGATCRRSARSFRG